MAPLQHRRQMTANLGQALLRLIEQRPPLTAWHATYQMRRTFGAQLSEYAVNQELDALVKRGAVKRIANGDTWAYAPRDWSAPDDGHRRADADIEYEALDMAEASTSAPAEAPSAAHEPAGGDTEATPAVPADDLDLVTTLDRLRAQAEAISARLARVDQLERALHEAEVLWEQSERERGRAEADLAQARATIQRLTAERDTARALAREALAELQRIVT